MYLYRWAPALKMLNWIKVGSGNGPTWKVTDDIGIRYMVQKTRFGYSAYERELRDGIARMIHDKKCIGCYGTLEEAQAVFEK